MTKEGDMCFEPLDVSCIRESIDLSAKDSLLSKDQAVKWKIKVTLGGYDPSESLENFITQLFKLLINLGLWPWSL